MNNDLEEFTRHLKEAKEIAKWNFQQRSMLGDMSPERDMWSAALGLVEMAIDRVTPC